MNTSKCLEILEKIKDYIPHWEEGLEALDFAIRDMDWKTHAEESMNGLFGSNCRPFTMAEYKAMIQGSDVCPKCEGQGHSSSVLTCPDCNGTGKIEIKEISLGRKESK